MQLKAPKKLHHLHHPRFSKRRFKEAPSRGFSKKLNSIANIFKEASMMDRDSSPFNTQPVTITSQVATSPMAFSHPRTRLHPNSPSNCKKLTYCHKVNKL